MTSLDDSSKPASRRLLSLDAFRGATIAGMILVNNPGSWSHVYAPLRHADWHGCTPTDLVFPFFVFILGVAIVFALSKHVAAGTARSALVWRISRRSAILFALGLLLSAWPILSFADAIGLHANVRNIRIPGVLQRLALCYAAGSLIYLFVPTRWHIACIATGLLGYWASMTLIPVPGIEAPNLDGKDTHLAAWIDRTLLDGHLWRASKTWDPEGILSTVPAICTALIGVQVGLLLRSGHTKRTKLVTLSVAAVALVATGLVWDRSFPINKPIWTSSYVLYTGGLATAALTFCYVLADVVGTRWSSAWTVPFVIYGRNAITVFVGSGILGRTFALIRIPSGSGDVSLKAYYYERFFTSWIPEPKLASLAHACAWVLAWFVVLFVMHRRGITLKV